ncbi:hypothetical protein DXX99_09235 [Ammonifex thiophilus]|uniref:Uncharacterized protein n=2 Tax=Ammonifex thiophilus TaxID=444093 RepID=A0A3D8P3U3_9THEO|nr:hypothetical protein DXX99_09235 [Ammonifex thiophilus]
MGKAPGGETPAEAARFSRAFTREEAERLLASAGIPFLRVELTYVAGWRDGLRRHSWAQAVAARVPATVMSRPDAGREKRLPGETVVHFFFKPTRRGWALVAWAEEVSARKVLPRAGNPDSTKLQNFKTFGGEW